MFPLLQFASDQQEHHIRQAIEALAQYFALTADERAQLVPSGTKFLFDDRVQWANTYLKQAGLLERVRRGTFRITDRGIKVLQSGITQINRDYLLQFPEFVEFQSRKRTSSPSERNVDVLLNSDQQNTPQDQLQESYQALMDELVQDLLDTIMEATPKFFEKLVMDLLLALGYGGAIEGAGEVVGRTGDDGIDVVIKEDKLGFDVIYVQAKRWARTNSVGAPDVQAFAGSLMGQGATKGVFVTTSSFTPKAISYASKLPNYKVILIDGQQLARLMIEHNVGVSRVQSYDIKRVDTDYFEAAIL